MSMFDCSIVMYHYVRDSSNSRFPDINTLTTDEFRYQLDYLESNYSLITVSDLQAAVIDDDDLPKNAALLTFDDGLADHYETVYPILKQRGIQGCFFPPAEPIQNDTVLNVHKIHTILAEQEDNDTLLDHVITLLHDYQDEYGLKSPNTYYKKLAKEGRYDPEEIVFIKRLLQHALPAPARDAIVDDLFNEYTSVDEATLSREWYMTTDQLRVMVNDGMYVGSHTAGHYWLNTLSQNETVSEVERSLNFLAEIGAPTTDWIMCYPYGGYNEITLEILQKYECRIGLTTEPRVADVTLDPALELPRLDTNDLPQSPDD